MKNIFLNYFNIFFIVVFFPSFVTGMFLPNFIYLLFITINFFYNFEKIKIIIFNYRKISFLFILFYFLILLSSLSSNHVLHSLESSALYFTLLIYVSSIIVLFKNNKSYRIIFYLSGIIVFLIISLDALYELVYGHNFFGNSAFEGRLAGLFGDRWVIGRYIVFFLPILFGIFLMELDSLNKIVKFFSIFIFFISILVVFFSGERAAFISMTLYLCLLLIYLIGKVSYKMIFCFVLVFSIMIISPFMFDNTSKRLQDNFLKYLTNFDINENQYLAMYNSGYKIFSDNLILGSGPNNFRYTCSENKYYQSKYSCSTHPHNIPIQLLSEVGIFGFLLVYSVFIYFFYKSIQLVRSKVLNKNNFGIFSLQCSIIIYLWPLMISGNFFLSWYSYIFYLPIGIYLMYIENKD